MCHSRTVNNKINKLNERILTFFYNNGQSTFGELLDGDYSFSTRYRNRHVLAAEMYKVQSNIAPDIMNNVFENKNIE